MEFGWSTEQHAQYDQMLANLRQAFGTGARDQDEAFFSPGDWKALADLGVLGLSVPTEYGGGGYGALDSAHLLEALGRGCPRTGLVFAACAHLLACTMPIVEYGADELRRRLIPRLCSGDMVAGNAMTEAEAGSDVSRLTSTGRRVAGGWLLEGTKSFVSNGPVADVLVTYATTDPSGGHLGLTAFVVETASQGVRLGEPFKKMGLNQCPAGPVSFERCFVPDEQVLGEPGQGAAIFQQSMAWERCCLFAGYLGVSDRILASTIDHVRTRRQFGKPLKDFQAVSHRIADMKLRTEAARLLLYRACWLLDQGERRALDIAMSKLAVSEAAVATSMDAVRIFAARGYLAADGIEAALRDSVPSLIFSGTSDIQRELIVRELLS